MTEDPIAAIRRWAGASHAARTTWPRGWGEPSQIPATPDALLALGDEGLYYRLLATRPMVWLGEISYEIFLIHLITMEFAMDYVVGYHVYTGSMLNLFIATLVLTIPLAWLLHRFTRVRD